jgi:hypothetical protein
MITYTKTVLESRDVWVEGNFARGHTIARGHMVHVVNRRVGSFANGYRSHVEVEVPGPEDVLLEMANRIA